MSFTAPVACMNSMHQLPYQSDRIIDNATGDEKWKSLCAFSLY